MVDEVETAAAAALPRDDQRRRADPRHVLQAPRARAKPGGVGNRRNAHPRHAACRSRRGSRESGDQRYVKVPPGSTSLRYQWTSPYAADVESDRGGYRLAIQAQPGMVPGPLRLTIHIRPEPDNGRQSGALRSAGRRQR